MRNKAIIIGIVALVAIGIVSWSFVGKKPANLQTTDKTVVRIGDLPTVHGLPLYLAKEKKYFEQAGVNVEIVKFEAPNQIVDALMQGKLDFGAPSIALGISSVANYKNPGKIKIYAIAGGTTDNPNDNLLIPSDSTITSIQELKGKKVGILGGSIQWRTIAREIFAQNGLDIDKDLTIVDLAASLQLQALSSKQIDALLAIEPTSGIILQKGIGKKLISGPAEQFISSPLYPGAGVVRTDFMTEHPELTKKVLDVLLKSIREIQADPTTAKQYLKGHTALTEDLITKIFMPDFKLQSELTNADRSSIQKFLDLFSKYKVVDGNMKLDDMLIATK